MMIVYMNTFFSFQISCHIDSRNFFFFQLEILRKFNLIMILFSLAFKTFFIDIALMNID